MLNKIKELADEAIALQNKDRMDVILREISELCNILAVVEPEKEYVPEINVLTEIHAGAKKAVRND